jgi:DNA polymerase IV
VRVACVLLPDFEAAVELRRRPELGGAPVVVGGLPHERKRVRGRSPEAAAAGVEVGMPLRQAQSLCPGARFLPADEAFYREGFGRVMEALDAFSPTVEGAYPASTDKSTTKARRHETGSNFRAFASSWLSSGPPAVYIDVSGTELLFGPEERLGRAMAAAVERVAGLRPQVGIADDGFVARVAAMRATPGGTVVVERGRARPFLAPLPVEQLPCSPEMLRRLHLLGLRTTGRLAALPAGALAEQFGPEGEMVARLARGEGDRPVVARETTPLLEEEAEIDPPASRLDHLAATTSLLAERLAARLRSDYAACREVSLWLDLSDGFTLHQSTLLHEPADQAGTLLRAVRRLMERMIGSPPGGRAFPVMLSAAKHLPGPSETQLCDDLETLRCAQGDRRAARQEPRPPGGHLSPALHLPDGDGTGVSRIRIELAGLGGHHGEQLGMFRSRAGDLKRARRTVRELEEQLGGGTLHFLAEMPGERSAGHPLRVMADEAGHPRALMLEGRWERVREVSNRWRVAEGWWRRELYREYYRVITENGRLCLIFRDLSPQLSLLPGRRGTGFAWFLERIYA